MTTRSTARPTTRLMALTLAVAAATCLPLVHAQAADKAALNALEGYFDFVDASAGEQEELTDGWAPGTLAMCG